MSALKKIKPAGLDYKEKLACIHRVTKATKGGRAFRFRALVVVGNENGIVGYGMGKSKEATEAIYKASERAKKNLVQVPLINGTIPHGYEAKFGGARVFIKPASSGTGVIAGGAVRIVLEMAGIKDVLSKSKGASSPHSVVKATVRALTEMRRPVDVAKLRGISLEKLFEG